MNRRASLAALFVLAALIETLLGVMLIIPDLQHHVGEVVALLLATSLLYILSAWLMLELSESGHSPARLILGAAIVFRITVSSLSPSFSDDLYRYRWEGMLQANGGNPYATAPSDPAWSRLRDSTYPKVDGKQVRAVYGPLLELQERAGYAIISRITADPYRQVLSFRLLSAVADLAAIAALLLLLRTRGLPLSRILTYAWCPLPIFEFWATGHNDAWIVLLIALALAAAASGRQSKAYLWLSLAAAAKFWPAILFPAFTRWAPRRIALAASILLAVSVVAVAPFGAAIFSNRDFTSGFLGGWRNNDSLFGLILAAVKDPYRAKHITFACVAAAAIAISFTRWTLERKALATVATLLIFSSNVHPWYAAWLLPMLVVEPLPAGFLFVSVVPVFYESVIGWTILHEWSGISWLRWPVYAGVALVASLRLRRPARVP